MHENDRLVNTSEAAKMLGLSQNTLRIWRMNGTGPLFLKLGRAVKYRTSDLAHYLTSNEKTATPVRPGTLGAAIHEFAQSYESRDPDYTPTAAGRAMIEDAINGFLHDYLKNWYKTGAPNGMDR